MRFLNQLEADKKAALILQFVNDGNSPAEVTGTATYYIDSNLQPCEYSNTPAFNGIVVAPKSPRTHHVVISQKGFSRLQVDDIQEGRMYFQMCIRATYSTLNEIYTFENCSYYSPELKAFMECKKE
jgi:hypothetical protein